MLGQKFIVLILVAFQGLQKRIPEQKFPILLPGKNRAERYMEELARIIVLEEGRHHGWPAVVGAPGLPDYVDPFLTFAPASAPPGDLIFYTGDLMPELKNDLFVSILGFQAQDRQTLMRIRFEDDSDPTRPTALERWFNDEEGSSVYGRLRGLAVGPDGALYVGTSNHDGRQFVERHRELPDRILRITPTD